MVLVGRLAGRADADQADDVRGGVGERVKAVGQDADGAARVAERDLRDGDGEVQEEDADEDARRRRTRRRAGAGAGLAVDVARSFVESQRS